MITNPYNQYVQQSIQTASPEKLLLMLFDGAIKFTNMGRQAILDESIEEAHNAIQRVEDIIAELMSTLNMEYEISKNLLSLYEYMHYRLVQANMKKDVEILDEVRGYLTDLRETFAEAAIKAKTGSQSKFVGGVNFEG